jgi:hypothetical protein
VFEGAARQALNPIEAHLAHLLVEGEPAYISFSIDDDDEDVNTNR